MRGLYKIFLECSDTVARDACVSAHSRIQHSQQPYDLGKAYVRMERVDQLSLFNS